MCPYTSKSKRYFYQHKKEHLGLFQCTQCSKNFGRSDHLKEHMKQHAKGYKKVVKKINECNISLRIFSRNDHLKTHMEIHHLDQGRIFKWDICGHAVKLKFYLNRHMLIHTKPHECKICNKRFSVKSKLLDHSMNHDPENFICKFGKCGKRFKSNQLLSNHIINLKHYHEHERIFKRD